MPISRQRHDALVDWVIANDPKIKEVKVHNKAVGFGIGVVSTSIGWILGIIILHFL